MRLWFDGWSLVLGLVSGVLSSWVVGTPVSIWGVGLIYGIILGSYFILYKRNRYAIGRLLGFVLISTTAFVAAVTFSMWLYVLLVENFVVTVFMGGMIGTGVLLAGVHFFCFSLNKANVWRLLLAGGILGLSWFIPMSFFDLEVKGEWGFPKSYPENFMWLFLVWQPGMSLLLGNLKKTERKLGK